MKTTVKLPFNKTNFNPLVFKTYKAIKKGLKYSIYLALLYFAYEGFMAWD